MADHENNQHDQNGGQQELEEVPTSGFNQYLVNLVNQMNAETGDNRRVSDITPEEQLLLYALWYYRDRINPPRRMRNRVHNHDDNETDEDVLEVCAVRFVNENSYQVLYDGKPIKPDKQKEIISNMFTTSGQESNQSYECGSCSFKTDELERMKIHISEDEKIFQFWCIKCGKNFGRMSEMNRHFALSNKHR